MRWLTKHLWNVGLASVSMLFLLSCLTLIPLSVASAHEEISGVATPTAVSVQATPTEDATVTALSKEQLTQAVAQQQHTWDNWIWSNAATILSSFLSTLVIVIGALFGLWRWRRDQHIELEKRAEERFQSAVTGLGGEKEGAQIGAAILLRTFLREGYEQFYTQVFDLAVAHLRFPRTSHTLKDTDVSLPFTTLNRALIVVFKEAFPLARNLAKRDPQSLDATGIQLDHAYLREADLKQVWMPEGSLRNVDLLGANLSGADLRRSDFRKANLHGANLSEANLSGANLSGAFLMGVKFKQAHLFKVDLSETFLEEADLSKAYLVEAKFGGANLNNALLLRADLSNTNIEDVLSLKDADLRDVTGLTKEQLEACKAKGAIIDEPSTISSSPSTATPPPPERSPDAQASLLPSAPETTQSLNTDGSSAASSQPDPESRT